MESKFYKIGEISKMLQVPASTLRYWETEFHQLRPVKSSGGQRFYNQKHIDLLQNLKQMLYNEKYTIDGAKKRLKGLLSREKNAAASEETPTQCSEANSFSPQDIKKELIDILAILK